MRLVNEKVLFYETAMSSISSKLITLKLQLLLLQSFVYVFHDEKNIHYYTIYESYIGFKKKIYLSKLFSNRPFSFDIIPLKIPGRQQELFHPRNWQL